MPVGGLKVNMEFINNYIGVEFDLKHNQIVDCGGVELLIAHEWVDREGDEESHTRTNANVNHLETSPQVATVLFGNENFPYRKGDRVFMHYMGYDCREEIEHEGRKIDIVDAEFIFAKIENGQFVVNDGIYLGERVFKNDLVLDSGIFLNLSSRPLASTIKITHSPKHTDKGKEWIRDGMSVITIDDNQYIFDYNGKKYVKLMASEIVGELNEEGIWPKA